MSQKIRTLMRRQTEDRDLAWLKKMLQAAIELELSTLPPYLCGMWSIRDMTSPAYSLILSVALEEMVHLGLACNMLTAIGGTPQIAQGYAKFISYPGPLPGGVHRGLTVYLGGLTKPYLHDVFMAIELPEEPVEIKAFAVTEVAPANDYPTIGAFYDAIEEAFNTLNPTLVTKNQLAISFGSHAVGVSILSTLAEITGAIDTIKSQGEGTSTSPFDSEGDLAHYYRFAEIYIGSTIVPASDGFAFSTPEIPFPDTYTMAPIPKGGYQNPAPSVATALNAFDSLFSQMLDSLDAAWRGGGDPDIKSSMKTMRGLRAAATALMKLPLPNATDGVYGPAFRYIPVEQRHFPTPPAPAPAPAPAPPTPTPTPLPAPPVFSDIVKILNDLGGSADGSPHGAFWNDDYTTFMGLTTEKWDSDHPGSLVVPGSPSTSNLYLALSGTGAFTDLQMPLGGGASDEQLKTVETWIKNNCPEK